MAKVVIELEGPCLRKAEVWAAYMALMAAVRGGPLEASVGFPPAPETLSAEAPVSEAPVEAVAPATTVAEMGPALTVVDALPEPTRKSRRTAKHPYGKATLAPEDRRPMYDDPLPDYLLKDVAPKSEEPPAEEAAEAILEQPSKEDFKQRMHDGFYLKHGAAALVNLLQVNVGVKRLVDVPEDRRNDVLRLAGII